MDFQPHKFRGIKLDFKYIFRENKGQVFSTDVLFALILITIAMGMSADALDIVAFKISDYSAGKSLDRIATDAANILIDTPGPPDWEKSNNTLLVTPGLAQDNNRTKNTTKVLSLAKITQLKTRYPELMANIIPPGGNSSLTIYPAGDGLEPLVVGNETPPVDVTEVTVVNRTVLVNFRDYRILTSITGSSPTEICPHNNYKGVTEHVKLDYNNKPDYNNLTSDWNCKCFKISQKDLNTTDFYILTDPSISGDNEAKWMLDRPDKISEKQENFQSQPVQINDRVRELIGDEEEASLWLHVSGDSSKPFNTYLVGVPKNTPSGEVRIEYLNPQPCFFVLKIWM